MVADDVLLALGEIVFDDLHKALVCGFDFLDFAHLGGYQVRLFVGLFGNHPAAGGLGGQVMGKIPGDNPRGVSAEAKAFGIIEFFHRAHQGHIAFADQILDICAGCMAACDADYEFEVRFDDYIF